MSFFFPSATASRATGVSLGLLLLSTATSAAQVGNTDATALKQTKMQATPTPMLLKQFGLELGEVHKQLQDTFGLDRGPVFVKAVAGHTEASRIGLQPNDIILAINEQAVKGMHGLLALFSRIDARAEIRLNILRHGVQQTLQLSVFEREVVIIERQRLNNALVAAREVERVALQEAASVAELAEQARNAVHDSAALIEQLEGTAHQARTLGMRVESITQQLASILGRDGVNGLFISSVVPKSPAHVAGIRKNDLLVAIDEHELHSPQILDKWLAQKPPSSPLRLRLERHGKSLSVLLVTKESVKLAQERVRFATLQDASLEQETLAEKQRTSSEQASQKVSELETQLENLKPLTLSASESVVSNLPAVTPSPAERRFHLAGRYQTGPSVLGPGLEYSMHVAAHVEIANMVIIGALETAITPGSVERGIFGVGVGFKQSIGQDWSIMASTELGAAIIHLSDTMSSSDFSVPTVRADMTLFNKEWISGWQVATGLGVRAMLVTTDGTETLTAAPDLHMGVIW